MLTATGKKNKKRKAVSLAEWRQLNADLSDEVDGEEEEGQWVVVRRRGRSSRRHGGRVEEKEEQKGGEERAQKKRKKGKKKKAPRVSHLLPPVAPESWPTEPVASVTASIAVASELELLTKSAAGLSMSDEEHKEALTSNGALAYATTGNRCLDLFYQAMLRGADRELVCRHMRAAWAESPVATIAVLMHARDPRDGKGERKCVQHGLWWLREYKTATYALNLRAFLAHGCYRDLLAMVAELPVPCPRLAPRGEALELEVLAWDVVNEPNSLAAKWAPTARSAFDISNALASRTARLMFPGSSTAMAEYRRALSAARERQHVTERLLCEGRVEEVKFEHVPAKAHMRWKHVFAAKRGEEYAEFCRKATRGEAVIRSKGLQPHELVSACLHGGADVTTEAQWRALVSELRGKGKLAGALSIVDVSGSMTMGNSSVPPLDVAIALGCLTATLCEGAFHNRVLTFSGTPAWHLLQEGATLQAQVDSIRRMDWEMNTNIARALNLILSTAVAARAPQEHLPKVLFVFSDMQFDECVHGGQQMPMLRERFAKCGYEAPLVVFWNLNGSMTAPATANDHGVALLSGFSGELLRLFMDGDFESISPLSILRKALAPYVDEVRIAKEDL